MPRNRRFVWGGAMKYVINKGFDSEQVVDADRYDYRADNKFITFWKGLPDGTIAVLTMRADDVYTVEAQTGG